MKSNKEAIKNEDEKDRTRTSYSELPSEETTPTKAAKKETRSNKDLKESWMFRKSKINKEKNDPERFSGDGVNFKAKIIGIEIVFDARGNRMCQETLQKLKSVVKTSGEHKQRILLNISLLGIRIKEEKTGEVLHHHPVHKISFISQDVGDNRAFGYVYGCPQTGHQFFGIKTEKTASLVVCTLRDLFHTALQLKKKEIEQAMEQQQEEEEVQNGDVHLNGREEASQFTESIQELPESKNQVEEEQVFFEWSPEHGVKHSRIKSPTQHLQKSVGGCTVENLLDLQFEMDSLQQGISQMDYTIASSVAARGFGISFSEDDNSISSGCSFPMTPRKLNRVSSVYHETLSTSSRSSSTSDYTAYTQDGYGENFVNFKNEVFNSTPPPLPPPPPQPVLVKEDPLPPPPPPPPPQEDKYAVFYEIDNIPSVFDQPLSTTTVTNDEPAKPLSTGEAEGDDDDDDEQFGFQDSFCTESTRSTPCIFAELDPLGNQPYVERENFFQDLKNPPKKVLKDLIGDSCDSQGSAFEPGPNLHLNPISEDSAISQESEVIPRNPFVSPPKLLPKRSFSVSSPLPPALATRLEDLNVNSTLPQKNPFNPFICDEEPVDVPPPSSPPPTPPPRLPPKEPEPLPPASPPPPRPPSRTSAAPTPPRPRRKVPFGSASGTWFSFDQEALTQAWNNTIPMSPPLPSPLRRPSLTGNKYESCSASNSPASTRRLVLNGGNLSRRKLTSQDGFEDKFVTSPPKHSFGDGNPEINGTECAEVNRILNQSPPLPPKSSGISRPRPSPSRKMLSAPSSCIRSSSASSSSVSSRQESSSSSLKYTSLEEMSNNLGSGSELLHPDNQAEETFSSGYNGGVSDLSSETVPTDDLSPDSIFRRKSDPFADDFFLSLPKKSSVSNHVEYSNGMDISVNGSEISGYFPVTDNST